MAVYSIGQLARAADVPASTIRYYERAGIIRPDFRTPGNYRAYSEGTLERLKFVRTAQSTGFSLGDISELLGYADSDKPPCDELNALLEKRLIEVRKRIEEFQSVERALIKSLRECCRGNSPDLCQEIIQMQEKKGARLPSAKKVRSRS